MNKETCKVITSTVGGIAKKVAEHALHAAIFAFVSKKVSQFMDKQQEKTKEQDKVRIEETTKTED